MKEKQTNQKKNQTPVQSILNTTTLSIVTESSNFLIVLFLRDLSY